MATTRKNNVPELTAPAHQTGLGASLRQILDCDPVPTFVINAEHVVTHWNRACEQVIGVPATEIVGTRNQWRAFYPNARPVLADIVLDGAREASIAEFYKGKYHPSGKIPGAFEAEDFFPDFRPGGRWLHFTAAPLHDDEGRVVGAIETLEDITERKLAELALRDLNGALEERVAERTRALTEANLNLQETITRLEETQARLIASEQAAEQANRAKSEFLANMSHEIRTPLNAVLGMGTLLSDTPLDATQQEFVHTIRGSGEALLSLINDILDYSKIEAGQMDLEQSPFELMECLDSALDLLALRAGEKRLELINGLHPTLPRAVIGDVTRLRQVLINLLSNAIKFTDRGHVLVHAEIVEGTPGTSLDDTRPVLLRFSIEDTGLGIPPDKQHLLFKSFSQVDASTTRKYGGTGLGLAICKRLVELMGGQLWVESKGIPGQGATFSFTVRLLAADEGLNAWESSHRARIAGRRILAVDDHPANLRILERLSSTFGMSCQSFECPQAALAAVEAGLEFDIGLLDMHMPGMDGAALARALNRHPGSDARPLILLSSRGIPIDADDRREFFGSLSKPYRFSALFDLLVKTQKVQPAGAAEASVSPQEQAPASPSPAARILLVEDNPTNQKVITQLLQKLGHTVDIAGHGLEAIDCIARQDYELVLMDMHMPVLGGLEATARIRASDSTRQPTIIALTANAMEADRQRCLAAGMNDFLAKPLRIPELKATLTRWLESAEKAETSEAP